MDFSKWDTYIYPEKDCDNLFSKVGALGHDMYFVCKIHSNTSMSELGHLSNILTRLKHIECSGWLLAFYENIKSMMYFVPLGYLYQLCKKKIQWWQIQVTNVVLIIETMYLVFHFDVFVIIVTMLLPKMGKKYR